MNNVCTSTSLSENSKDPKGGYFRQCHYMVMINIKTTKMPVVTTSKEYQSISNNTKFKTDLL